MASPHHAKKVGRFLRWLGEHYSAILRLLPDNAAFCAKIEICDSSCSAPVPLKWVQCSGPLTAIRECDLKSLQFFFSEMLGLLLKTVRFGTCDSRPTKAASHISALHQGVSKTYVFALQIQATIYRSLWALRALNCKKPLKSLPALSVQKVLKGPIW